MANNLLSKETSPYLLQHKDNPVNWYGWDEDAFVQAEKENKPINPIKKKPDWIRSKLSNSKEFFLTKTIVNNNNLVTVCQEANCPNITECWSKRHATFMIMGDTCTRACAFCDVKTGLPGKLDQLEPVKIAEAVKKLNLKHVVITSCLLYTSPSPRD